LWKYSAKLKHLTIYDLVYITMRILMNYQDWSSLGFLSSHSSWAFLHLASCRHHRTIKVEKDTMGKTKLVNEFFWISYILFFGMYLKKYQNLRIGFQAYFKNIPRKSYPPLKSKKMSFFHFSVSLRYPKIK
jgi:hypothetical protein